MTSSRSAGATTAVCEPSHGVAPHAGHHKEDGSEIGYLRPPVANPSNGDSRFVQAVRRSTVESAELAPPARLKLPFLDPRVLRGVAALAGDANPRRYAGRSLTSYDLAKEYGVTDTDGSQPYCWGYIDTYGTGEQSGRGVEEFGKPPGRATTSAIPAAGTPRPTRSRCNGRRRQREASFADAKRVTPAFAFVPALDSPTPRGAALLS